MKNKFTLREEAAERQEVYNSMTLQQKYDYAVKHGHENTKQASKLKRLLEKEKS